MADLVVHVVLIAEVFEQFISEAGDSLLERDRGRLRDLKKVRGGSDESGVAVNVPAAPTPRGWVPRSPVRSARIRK